MSPLDVSLFPFEKKTEKKGNDRVSPAATDSVIKKRSPKQNKTKTYTYISAGQPSDGSEISFSFFF